MSKKRSGRVSNIKDLNKEINKILVKAMNKENSVTSSVIKETQSDMVDKVVYAAYDTGPYVYERRGSRGGGLGDTRNMEHEAAIVNDKTKMVVLNTTPPHPDFTYGNFAKGDMLADLIEGGDGRYGIEYDFKRNRSQDAHKYLFPRPFQAATVRSLQSNKDHVDALALDLMMHGLKVERKGR